MQEPANRRCPRCGAALSGGRPCCSEACSTNRETLRPRPSQPEDLHAYRPSGAFEVQQNPRTTLRDLAKAQSDLGSDDPVGVPAQPRVPSFPENDVGDDPEDSDR
jgi:hypothetical protein